MSGTDSIPLLRPGETMGPFEIRIPRAVVFYLHFRSKTTRWERALLRTGLMRRAWRRELYERFRPWFDEHGRHE